MRRQLIAQAPWRARFSVRNLLPKLGQLTNQQIELPLLANDDQVELIDHVFGEAGLDLQISQTLFNIVRLFHPSIEPEFRTPRRLRAIVE